MIVTLKSPRYGGHLSREPRNKGQERFGTYEVLLEDTWSLMCLTNASEHPTRLLMFYEVPFLFYFIFF